MEAKARRVTKKPGISTSVVDHAVFSMTLARTCKVSDCWLTIRKNIRARGAVFPVKNAVNGDYTRCQTNGNRKKGQVGGV